jgi:hypothetical protein
VGGIAVWWDSKPLHLSFCFECVELPNPAEFDHCVAGFFGRECQTFLAALQQPETKRSQKICEPTSTRNGGAGEMRLRTDLQTVVNPGRVPGRETLRQREIPMNENEHVKNLLHGIAPIIGGEPTETVALLALWMLRICLHDTHPRDLAATITRGMMRFDNDATGLH